MGLFTTGAESEENSKDWGNRRNVSVMDKQI